MTRSRRALIALMTALSLFVASLGAQRAQQSERSIRPAPSGTAAIVAFRAAVTAVKARAAQADQDSLLGDLALPPPPFVAIAAAAFVGRVAVPLASFFARSTLSIAARARAPPTR